MPTECPKLKLVELPALPHFQTSVELIDAHEYCARRASSLQASRLTLALTLTLKPEHHVASSLSIT